MGFDEADQSSGDVDPETGNFLESTSGGDGEKPEGDYIFPEIRSQEDIQKLFKYGSDLIREFNKRINKQGKERLSGGSFVLTLGYLSELFGGLEGIKDKKLIEVGGGSKSQLTMFGGKTSYEAGTTQVLSELGSEVILVDPAARKEDFPKATVISERFHDYIDSKNFEKGDIVCSTAFLGGPEWFSNQNNDSNYTNNLLIKMSELSDIQVHLVQQGEFRLDAIDVEYLAKNNLEVVYNLNVTRDENKKNPSADNTNIYEDYIVISKIKEKNG